MEEVYGVASTLKIGEIAFNSQERTSGTVSEPSFVTNNIDNIFGLKVKACEIPFSFYLFSGCAIIIGGINARTITIGDGNYTVSSILSDPQGLASSGFTFSYNIRTLKFSVTHGSAAFTVCANNARCAQLLGLSLDPQASSQSSPFTYEFPYAASITGPMYLNLHSNLGAIVSSSKRNSSVNMSGTVIARIPIVANPGNIIFFREETEKVFNCGESGISHVNFWLTFPGETAPINMNGQPYTVELSVIQSTVPNGILPNRRYTSSGTTLIGAL